jgi:hypothetical protein
MTSYFDIGEESVNYRAVKAINTSIFANIFLISQQLKALCKIWGFHGGDYEEWFLLGCYAVWLL